MANPQHQAELGQEGREVRRGHLELEPAGFSWPTVLGFGFLTFNSGMAVYRSRDDPWNIAFVVGSYCDLALLFCCLRGYERGVPESPRRRRIKAAVWLLTTLLMAMFAYKVAAVMPLPVAVLVWLMTGAAAVGFYAFFIHDEGEDAAGGLDHGGTY